jgi:hypothetical protein
MRRRLVAALVASLSLAGPVRSEAQDAKAEVVATIKDFMRGLKIRDTALVAAQIDSLTRFTLIRPGPSGSRIVVARGTDFIRMAGRTDQPPLDEPTRNPVVQIDGDLASVWTEYQVRRDGKVTHCGYDAFHLARLGGKWKIINVSDSFRPEGCGAPWPDQP